MSPRLAVQELHEETLRRSLREHRGYSVTITGHSLGAGVASYTAVLLQRRLGRRVKVRAFAFAPPCTLPLRASRRLGGCWWMARRPLVDGYVYHNDLVPRLSVGSLHALLEALELAQDPACTDDTLARHLRRRARHPHRDARFPPGRLTLLVPARGAPPSCRACSQRGLGLIRLQRSMLRDHGFDKYEGALAAVCSDTHNDTPRNEE